MPDVKNRHRLSTEQRFQKILKYMPEENPVFPAVMHSIERYVSGATDQSKMDEIVYQTIAQHPEIHPEMLRSGVDAWHSLPASIKVGFVPAELAALSSREKLDTRKFQTLLYKATKPQQRRVVAREPLWSQVIPKMVTFVSPVTITSIAPTDPDGYPYITLGEPFTIYGSDFSTNNAENQIIIFRMIGEVAQPGITVTPTRSQPDRLEAVAPIPAMLGEGDYVIYVQVQNQFPSNHIDAHFANPPKAAATITSVSPASQYSGKMIVINGNNFEELPRVFWQAIDPTISGATPVEYYYCTEAEWRGTTQVAVIVPDQFLSFPGNYLIAVAGKGQNLSNWYPFTVRPYTYQVQFTQIKCIDESDWEWPLDDIIVTSWAIATGNQAWTKSTGSYTGFEDGTIKSYNTTDSSVFPITGGAGEVIDYLLVITKLYETHEDDVKAVMGFVADLGKAIGSKFFGDKVGEWIAKAVNFLDPLVDFFVGDPNFLGSQTLKWTAVELRDKTNNPYTSFTGTLDFLNDDDTGSYQLSFRVDRGEGE